MTHDAIDAAIPDPARPVAAPEAPGPLVYGVIDMVRGGRVAGWAIDRRDAAAAVDVDILREGELVCRVRADRRRADLEKGGVGAGCYGFRVDLDPPVEPGLEFTVVAVARAADGATAELGRVGAAASPPAPATRLLERIFDDLARLRAQAAARPPPALPDAERLALVLDRIEVVQARIEAALAAASATEAPAADRSLRPIAFGALTLALVSLGTGLYSLFVA